MQKGLIAIATTERNSFSWSFIKSLLELNNKSGCGVVYTNIGAIDMARNHLLLMALQAKVDYVCMLDSDMIVPADGIDRLLKTMKEFDTHIGTGIYFKGEAPHDAVAFDYVDDKYYIPIKDWSKKRLVDGVGMGFTIIKKELFGVSFGFTKHNGRLIGEDITFCHVARQKGYKIVLDNTIKLGHIRTVAIDEEYIKKNEIK
jgi:GT2 family glycosyltransferase